MQVPSVLLLLVLSASYALGTPPHQRRQSAPAAVPSLAPIPAAPANWSESYIVPSGQHFALSATHDPFYFAGCNMWWMMNYTSDWVDAALGNASAQGMRVVRTWFFHDGWFTNIDPVTHEMTFNEEGVRQLDYVLDSARRHGVKLIATLANNWHDLGGVHYYVTQTNYTYHSDFFTQPELVGLYKQWISYLLNRKNTISGTRYGSDPTIFAWELMNEPRCLSYTEIKSPNCTTATMTSWISDISGFIKRLAPKTMVTIGDEGWFSYPELKDNWLYDGFNGIDFDANLGLETIDFGTFHTYPDHGWGAGTTSYYLSFEWGEQWIRQHATMGAAHNKPVINEEYGWSAVADRLSYQQLYFAISEDIGIAGDLFWQFWIPPPDGSPIPAGEAANASYTPGLNVYSSDSDWGVFRQHIWNMAQLGSYQSGKGGNLTCVGGRNMFCIED